MFKIGMALLKYFQHYHSVLPKPDGPLSQVVPSLSISAANKAVMVLLDPPGAEEKCTSQSDKREGYDHFTPEEKARIGKRSAEHGIAATIHYFSKRFPGRSVKECNVLTWKMKYLHEIAVKKRAGKDVTVKVLADKKIGCPLWLGYELEKQVQAYLKSLRENGAVINTAMACADGIVKSYDSNVLECNGGYIVLTNGWAKYLMKRMGFGQKASKYKSKGFCLILNS